MAFIESGKVKDGGIVLSKPLELPEGTEVVVYIEPLEEGKQATVPSNNENFAALPFFGIWADREDMSDSTAWVRKERERWQRRLEQQD